MCRFSSAGVHWNRLLQSHEIYKHLELEKIIICFKLIYFLYIDEYEYSRLQLAEPSQSLFTNIKLICGFLNLFKPDTKHFIFCIILFHTCSSRI